MVHGPQWGHYACGPKPRGVCAGVSFRAGAAGAVLGVPMSELAGQHLALNTLWPRRGARLLERLREASGPRRVLEVLEHELSAQLCPPLLMHPAVAQALQGGSLARADVRIGALARELGYSSRHFIALFRRAVGLTPKHYQRVQRLHTLLRQLAGGGSPSLAALAADGGYADQAHLTREFRALAGITPSEYRPAGPASPLHHRVGAGREVKILQDPRACHD